MSRKFKKQHLFDIYIQYIYIQYIYIIYVSFHLHACCSLLIFKCLLKQPCSGGKLRVSAFVFLSCLIELYDDKWLCWVPYNTLALLNSSW